jgi:hypothetical protein
MVGMHLGILLLLDITSVSIAMLLVHLFIMDATWFRRAARISAPSAAGKIV